MTSMDISTSYLGMKLTSPFIVASSELTDSVDKIKQHEINGAGAVVLKSLFEEQILAESYNATNAEKNNLSDAFEYIQQYQESYQTDKHLQLIKDAKKQVSIPIIASIHSSIKTSWINYARLMEQAGADALEVNISLLPTDIHISSSEIEKQYLDIACELKHSIKIPVALKLSPYFSSIPNILYNLFLQKIDGVVLFNRFYEPDINIQQQELVNGDIYTGHNDFHQALRWIGILSDAIRFDFSASTGIHNSETAIKMLLAGAKTIQVASIIYKNGSKYLTTLNDGLKSWMEKNDYLSLQDFIGKCNFKNIKNPNGYARIQFMKYFSKIQ